MKYKTELTLSEPSLDPSELLYVKVYLHRLNHKEAHKAADPNIKHYKEDNKFRKRANISYHINKGMQSKIEASELTEEDIISKLYEEATYTGTSSNHAARITALTLLGKHLGLFNDRKNEEGGVVYNIVNYKQEDSPSLPPSDEEVEFPEAIEEIEEVVLDPLITITDFNTGQGSPDGD